MRKSRDRHGRGIRGPIALPNPITNQPVPMKTLTRLEYFGKCVVTSLTTINNLNPQLLDKIDVAIEEVPALTQLWQADRVPLAAAASATAETQAQILLYRRPLERRAASRHHLAELIHLTLVEQISALTGKDTFEIDPLLDRRF